jgi:methyl coenzyme M reductase gamma subunit
MSEEELVGKSVIYTLRTVSYRDANELWEVTGQVLEQNVKGGLNPELANAKKKEEH